MAPTVTAGPITAAPATAAVTAEATLPPVVVHGQVTVVEGTSVFVSGDSGEMTTDADGVQHARGGRFTFTEVMNDPRVSGLHIVTDLGMDYWGESSGNDGAIVQWATERIENEQGAWVGSASGIWSKERGDILVGWLRGTGGYEGLTYFMAVDSRDLRDGVTSVYRVRGQIFPGEPPAP